MVGLKVIGCVYMSKLVTEGETEFCWLVQLFQITCIHPAPLTDDKVRLSIIKTVYWSTKGCFFLRATR